MARKYKYLGLGGLLVLLFAAGLLGGGLLVSGGHPDYDAAGEAALPSASPASYSDQVFLLARLIHGEARGEPYVGQVAVGAVVLNRVKSPNFPNSLSGVIFQPFAFTAVFDGQFWQQPGETALRSARDALSGWDPSNGSLYYWNPAKAISRWIWSRPIVQRIGQHVFAR